MSDRGPFDGAAIIGALAEGGVEFIIIGGLAAGAHGHVRGTMAIDIVPAPDDANLERLARKLRSLDYRILGTGEPESEELSHPDVEHLKAGGSWVLATKHGGLDILQSPEPGLDYHQLRRNAIVDTLFGRQVRFCGYDDLLAMKKAAGRPQDVADLERLRAIRAET